MNRYRVKLTEEIYMDVKITQGFRVEDGTATVPLVEQSDDAVRAAFEEARKVGEARGLWIPASAGSLVVAETVETPSMRDQLLASVEQGVGLYGGVIVNINAGRKVKNQIPIMKPSEYRERAEDWLTDSRLAAAKLLPTSEDRPLLLIPRLTRAVTTEAIVDSWKSSADGKLWTWSDRMKFLSNWTADQLSGFDPELEGEVPFIVLPTAYDQAREGTVKNQRDDVEVLQEAYPELDVATIFDGAVIARRYSGGRRKWQDSYVRAVNLDPHTVDGFDVVPRARVYDDNHADIDGSAVGVSDAARLRLK
ncbi:MAG: hypothetical protein JWS12_372 [Candidatus Saccharibacteria bacterium]|nr:hypothetical protein [Candidatus Saccharibacteria bacterium]